MRAPPAIQPEDAPQREPERGMQPHPAAGVGAGKVPVRGRVDKPDRLARDEDAAGQALARLEL